MVYKLLDESCDYIDNSGKRWNLLEANIAWTPNGVNIGWDTFNNIEEAMEYYSVRYEPLKSDII